jgi:hypothetical protein
MQTTLPILLALLLAHLLADFPLQSRTMVLGKKTAWTAYLKHGLVHYLAAVACLLVFTSQPCASVHTQGLLILYVLVHLGIDASKQVLIAKSLFPDCARLFLADQAAHLVTITGLTWMLSPVAWVNLWIALNWSATAKLHFLAIAIVYVGVLFGGGYFVRHCTRSLSEQSLIAPETPEELRNAGLYIGWLERFLVVTAILVQSPTMIGLILTGKSIARYPELKQARFAEYFLIGTFLSISIALIGGLILARCLYGTASFK